ncbi:Uncharacterised protein [Candidatus Burarchaeum australiense]|nr:Uncharacterised protein [Candidatus Burarchaeum australiense]
MEQIQKPVNRAKVDVAKERMRFGVYEARNDVSRTSPESLERASAHFSDLSFGRGGDMAWKLSNVSGEAFQNFFPRHIFTREKKQAARELAADYAIEHARSISTDESYHHSGYFSSLNHHYQDSMYYQSSYAACVIYDAVQLTKEAYGMDRAVEVAKELGAKDDFPKQSRNQATDEFAADHAFERAKSIPKDDLNFASVIDEAIRKTKEAYGLDRAVEVAEELGNKMAALELLARDLSYNSYENPHPNYMGKLERLDRYASALVQDPALAPEDKLRVFDINSDKHVSFYWGNPKELKTKNEFFWRSFKKEDVQANISVYIRGIELQISKAQYLETMERWNDAANAWKGVADQFVNLVGDATENNAFNRQFEALNKGLAAVDKALGEVPVHKEKILIRLKTNMLGQLALMAVGQFTPANVHKYYEAARDHMLNVRNYEALAYLSFKLGTQSIGDSPFPDDVALKLDEKSIYYLNMARDAAIASKNTVIVEYASELLDQYTAYQRLEQRRINTSETRLS